MFGVRCFLVVSFLSSCVAVGQIFRLDQHAFPTVTVWYIPQDAQQLSPPVRIRDNGQNVALLEHTCIKQPSPRAIELVVCVDISSSNAAQVASRAIMDTIAATLATELSGYDCRFHVVAFNTAVTSYRNIQATELSSIFASLRFGGGTSYTAAFEEAAQILSTPSDRARWLLLITDGLDTVEIGSIRSLFGTSPPRVAALMLRNEAPECIRELARSTDGSWLELDPTIAREVQLRPGVGVALAHPKYPARGVILPLCIPHRQPRRNAYAARQHRHRRGIAIAVGAGAFEQEKVHIVAPRR